MANQFKTSRKTELVTLRALTSMNYLTVGSKKYFKDQLKHKRNGKKFEFVITDAGEYQRGIDLSAGQNDSASRAFPSSVKRAWKRCSMWATCSSPPTSSNRLLT